MTKDDLFNQFRKFIAQDEGRRGYLLCFTGEANTTWFSILFGLFAFVFTRRFTSLRTYEHYARSKITHNYIKRIKSGKIETFSLEIVEEVIVEMKKVFQEKDKSFWSGNSSTHVQRARLIQRAKCYHNAITGDLPNSAGRNPDNTFFGAIKGAFLGFFGGLAAWVLFMLVLFLVVGLIVFIVELF